MTLNFKINGQYFKASRLSKETVSDSIGCLEAEFEFSGSEWESLSKTAIFTTAEGASYEQLLTNGCCIVPWEAIKAPYFNVSVYGLLGTEKRLTTNSAVVKVINSGYVEGQTPSPPTPDVYAQILEIAENAENIAQSVRNDADAGEFDGHDGTDATVTADNVNAAYADATAAQKQAARENIGAISTQAFPAASQAYVAAVTVSANAVTNIAELTGNITITLGTGLTEYDNEWAFTVTQGATAYDVALPTIEWYSDAPAFAASSTTECRLFYVGSALCGVAVSV